MASGESPQPPAAPPASSPGTPPPAGSEPSAVTGWAVLLFCADLVACKRVCGALEGAGLRVNTVSRWDALPEALDEQSFEAVLLHDVACAAVGGVRTVTRVRPGCGAARVVWLDSERSYDVAVAALRAGAAEVIDLSREGDGALVERVSAACRATGRARQHGLVVREVDEFLELFLRKLMDAARQAQREADRAGGYSGRWDLEACTVLVVDDNPSTAPGLSEALGQRGGYRVVSAVTGGEGMDLAGREPFHIALVKDTLPDLPGSIVARTLRGQTADGMVLLFQDKGSEPGRVSLVEDSKSIELIPRLVRASQLVDQIHELRDAYAGKLREKRYLEGFRQTYYDFLKQYVELRRKLANLSADGAS